ncbi:MAG: glycosyltransferase [Flavobacterium sp.]|nr:MAG: glycosyltransferase [Flavobacterium sp.]
MKLLIILTHPIQYYAPIFQQLSQQCDLKVFYTWGDSCLEQKFDPGFGKKIEWDIPLLNGYQYEMLKNVSKQPGSHKFNGIHNPNIISKINSFNPDAILIFGWAYKSHLKVIRHFKGKIPLWFRGDSTLLNQNSGFKSWLRIKFLTWVYSHINKFFYVGTANEKYFEACKVKQENLVWAPHAIDNSRFAVKENKKIQDLRVQLKISDKHIIILYAGKFEEVKNLKILIEAFKLQKNKNLHLLMVGNGPEEQFLKDLRNNNIHFLDFQNQSEIPSIYHASDLCCLPSKSETWGLTINEAMAAGKAILVSDRVGCASDLIKENGMIFKHDDLHDLANKIHIMTASRQDLITMGEKSRKIIRNWTFEKISETIIEELSKLNKK